MVPTCLTLPLPHISPTRCATLGLGRLYLKSKRGRSRASQAGRHYHLCPKDTCTHWPFNTRPSTSPHLVLDSLMLPPLSWNRFLEELLPDFSITSTWLQHCPHLPCVLPFSLAPQMSTSHSLPPPLRADLLIGLMDFQGGGGERRRATR